MHTDIRKWISEAIRKWREDGASGFGWAIFHVYLGAWITLTSRFPLGTNIFNHDWDMLIVLDACRVDALREIADEYEFLTEIKSVYSVGSTSSEWIAKTFSEPYYKEIEETAYITGNPFAERLLQNEQSPPTTETDSIDLPVPACSPAWNTVREGDLQQLHISRASKDSGGINPRPITEKTILTGRNKNANRLLVHYMQPHAPFVGKDLPPELQGTDMKVKLRQNAISKDAVWDAYLDTLRYILDEVEVLLNNVDADKVVITADHGEGFGEHGSYSHYFGWPHPVIKKVPWVETTATDANNYTVRTDPIESQEDSMERRLHDLGYLDN